MQKAPADTGGRIRGRSRLVVAYQPTAVNGTIASYDQMEIAAGQVMKRLLKRGSYPSSDGGFRITSKWPGGRAGTYDDVIGRMIN